MTTRFFSNLQTTPLILCLLVISGCEEPTSKGGGSATPAANEVAEVEMVEEKPQVIDSVEPATAEVAEKNEPEENVPGYPHFHVYRNGDQLMLEGALKSNAQIEQIESELKNFFTKLKIESSLRKDHLRHGVGWGNRICDAVLFDYFTVVSDPDLEYKEGIITLKGKVKSSREHKQITERVIAGFSGIWTKDLANEIEVLK